MYLIVMRHGVAERLLPGQADGERPLTEAGRRRIERQALALFQAGLCPEALFCSPYRRALETAETIAGVLGMPYRIWPGLRPGADLDAYAAMAAEVNDRSWVMTVHHQPDVSGIVQVLTGASVPMEEGAMAVMEVRRMAAGGGALRGLYAAEPFVRLGEALRP
jgi:phosphohistidine phosphatase